MRHKRTLPCDDIAGESARPDLEVAVASEGREQVYPRLEGVLVHREPERDAAWLGAPRCDVGEGEHLPGVNFLRGTVVGEVDIGGRLLWLTRGDDDGVKQGGKILL